MGIDLIKVQGILISVSVALSMVGLEKLEAYKEISHNWLFITLLIICMATIFGYGTVKLFDILEYNKRDDS